MGFEGNKHGTLLPNINRIAPSSSLRAWDTASQSCPLRQFWLYRCGISRIVMLTFMMSPLGLTKSSIPPASLSRRPYSRYHGCRVWRHQWPMCIDAREYLLFIFLWVVQLPLQLNFQKCLGGSTNVHSNIRSAFLWVKSSIFGPPTDIIRATSSLHFRSERTHAQDALNATS